MLLMFYTPWCSACKTVKKEFKSGIVMKTYAKSLHISEVKLIKWWINTDKNSIKPVYAEVAKLVAEDNVILAAVDCEQGSDTDFARSLPYNVTAYPTILYYQRGKLQFPYNHGHKKVWDSHRPF